ncbi:DUF2326 domain-containing protein [Candidatus Nitrospira allomarina]|uniref:DUF2326 domain-containing protein n=1 Tax=Candidatus Nitrospira allomarina TaxID=3020900 RepID=A0AA96GH78_9BACT|nr:DUF2326 domain-containing protein [Candidatus Nitrospira allomarina]WNM60110.1 DUF2326 domain-containing protein [Candidatus Nitrospira allomarina]
MLKIKKLYTEPGVFDPISFVDGFNLILGEKKEGNVKTNGVGKSIVIEFLNYALLKQHKDSRVALIPEQTLSREVTVCLDFEIGEHKITSKRTIKDHDCPVLIINGHSQRYSTLADANNHLGSLLFENLDQKNPPSFRIMMGPLIRDEGSEFKSIIDCYDTTKRIPPDYTPHLYLLHVDPLPYNEARQLYKEMENLTKAKSKIEENIKVITNKNVSESKSDLNELESQVRRIQSDIDRLENIEGFGVIKDEIIEIENRLERERSKQAVLKSELSKLQLFHGDNYIDGDEVAELYNQFKEGLGDLIKRELDEVTIFKKKIDNFQRNLIDQKRGSIVEALQPLNENISELSRLYKEKILLLDQEGLLISLKQTIAIHARKIEELSALSSFIKAHNQYESDHKSKKRERENKIYLLESYRNDSDAVVRSFEKTILDIHEYVFGNRKSSFDIEISKRKEILKFELRTDSDGSHSINREKVFLYDYALLINPYTSELHPGLLVHDNIFDVDQDTLIKSINYIGENLNLLNGKQYILTINRDKFSESDMELLNLDLDGYARASFTKSNKFLKTQYQELTL